MTRLTSSHRLMNAMSRTYSSIKNSRRYLPTASGVGSSGVPMLISNTPVLFMRVLENDLQQKPRAREFSPGQSAPNNFLPERYFPEAQALFSKLAQDRRSNA